MDGHPPKQQLILRCSLTLLLAFFFFLSLIAAFISIFIDNFFASNPVSIASHCTIVSTSVDLRSSKVCELGLLNYKAKNVFYPLESTRFRCRYDYYWTSVFKVEYKEHSSGRTRRALAEAPKEALPIDCRPSFGTAWLTKEKFKVNETYDCRYTPGISQVDIYSDGLFNCHAKDPSITEVIRRFFIFLTRITYSLFSGEGRYEVIIRDSVAGVFAGMFTALISMSLIKLLHIPKSRRAKTWEARKLCFAVYGVHLKRACFLVAYLSVMGWLTIQYGKMLGLSEIFIRS